jgi:hypothetical protein
MFLLIKYFIDILKYKISRNNLSKYIKINKTNNLIQEIVNLKTQKNTDTFFILGGGTSIAELTKENFDLISKNISIGINNWINHKYVPDIYLYEMARKNDIIYNPVFHENFKIKAADYENVLIVLKDVGKAFYDIKSTINNNKLFKDTYYPLMLSVDNYGLKFWEKYDIKLKFLYFFQKLLGEKVVQQQRMSITFAIDLARKCGFRKIVLCGVDLNSTKYFWEISSISDYIDNRISIPVTLQAGSIHSTMDVNINKLKADQVLFSIQNTYKTLFGIDLFVSSKNSLLYPTYPLYFI